MSLINTAGFDLKHHSPFLDDCMAFILGNSICIWNFVKKKRDYIWSKKNGFSACASNNVLSAIAASDYGLEPDIHLYKYPSKEEFRKLPPTAIYSYIDLEFSHDGSRLAATSSLPEYTISLYDVHNSKIMRGAKEGPVPKNYKKTIFNPKSPDTLIYYCADSVTFLQIEKCIDKSINPQNNETELTYRFTSQKFLLSDSEITSALWDCHSRLLLSSISTNNSNPPKILILQTNATVILTIDVPDVMTIHSICLTQKHIIASVVKEEIVKGKHEKEQEKEEKKVLDKLQWHIYDDAENTPKFTLDTDQELKVEEGSLEEIFYNKQFNKLIGVNNSGTIKFYPLAAANIIDEEEEEEKKDDEEKEKSKEINIPHQLVGNFHSGKVIGILELPDTSQIVTAGLDKYLKIWETSTMTIISQINIKEVPSTLAVDSKGAIAFVGSEKGGLRIYDISQRIMPKLIQLRRFFETPIKKISFGIESGLIAISSNKSDRVYFVSTSASLNFKVCGFLSFKSNIMDTAWANDKDGKEILLILLENSLLASTYPPPLSSKCSLEPLILKHPILYNRVDTGMKSIIALKEIGLYITGDDKLLKKYDYPDSPIDDFDLRKPPNAPVSEIIGHNLAMNCWSLSYDGQIFVSGGLDGSLFMRRVNSFQQYNEIKNMSVRSGGVTALSFSTSKPFLFTAGGDGSIFVWTLSPKQTQIHPANSDAVAAEIQQMDEKPDLVDEDIELYMNELKKELEAENQKLQDKMKEEIKKDLTKINKRVQEILESNDELNDIEKLPRDELVIDVNRRERLLKERDQICEDIRKKASNDILRLEIMRSKIKERTWDIMEVQFTACKSISTEKMIYNFAIRKPISSETAFTDKLVNQRKIELLSFIERKIRNKLAEIANTEDFSNEVENYIVNRFFSKPEWVEELQERANLNAMANRPGQAANQAGAQEVVSGKKLFLSRRNMFFNRNAARKALEEAEKEKAIQLKKDEKSIDDTRWVVKNKKPDFAVIKQKINDLGPWEILYEPFELVTNSRRRAQIYFMKRLINEVKQDFNKEFDKLCETKDKYQETINEKNNRIAELQRELKQEPELFAVKTDKDEKPNHILTVEKNEITVIKHYSKEEMAKIEEEKKKEDERLRLLQADSVGQRGIKQMMGGTLKMKKDTDILDEVLVKEEWMNKPEEQMTEEERASLKLFQEKEKELQEKKDKQRKAWEMELKKNRAEINDICLKFEDQLAALIKKKLFVQLRIYELELYMIRLTVALYESSARFEAKIEKENILKKLKEEIDSIEEKKNIIRECTELLNQEHQQNNTKKSQLEQNVYRDVNVIRRDAAVAFLQKGKAYIRENRETKGSPSNMDKKKDLIEDPPFVSKLSPYLLIEREIAKDLIRIREIEGDEQFNVVEDNFNSAKLTHELFKKLIDYRQMYAPLQKREIALLTKDEAQKAYEEYIESLRNEKNMENERQQAEMFRLLKEMEESKYNVEIIARIKQGQIEIELDPIAHNLSDAVIINTDVIDSINDQILENHQKKKEKLEKLGIQKAALEYLQWKNELIKLEIDDLIANTNTVNYERITKKTVKMNPEELKFKEKQSIERLESQMKKLEENVKSRIKNINEKETKLKKEIEDKKEENEQLDLKARKLKENVTQRQVILELKSGSGEENLQDPAYKFKIISTKRKLVDMVRQQTDDIAMLREELNRIRERTFPSFAHIHTKVECPDEKI